MPRVVFIDSNLHTNRHYRVAMEKAGFGCVQVTNDKVVLEFLDLSAESTDLFVVNPFILEYWRVITLVSRTIGPDKGTSLERGVGVIRAVQERFPDARIVILTGQDLPDEQSSLWKDFPYFKKDEVLPIEFAERLQWLATETATALS